MKTNNCLVKLQPKKKELGLPDLASVCCNLTPLSNLKI